jgi:hypothetical protein
MKTWLIRFVLLVAIAAVGYWLVTILFPNPERVIRKRFGEVAKLASFSGNEAPLAKLMNSQKLAGYFSPDVELMIDVPGGHEHTISGRQELMQAAAAARNTLSALQVDFPDVVVTLGPDRASAVVNLTATAKVPGDRDFFVQEMKCQLQKQSGDWLITRLETIKTLQ